MKIVVTGGAGFIGSHVTDAYVDAGHDVVVVDDLSTGREENLNARARFVRLDIRDCAAVGAIFARERPEVLNHHAAQMDVRRSVASPVWDAGINVIGLLNLLEAGRASGLQRAIFASSGGTVYGEPERLPVGEEAPTAPRCPYGVSKLAGEHYLGYYAAVHGIKTAVLRYANVYGPRQNPHGEAGVVAIFAGQLLGGGQPAINGSGEQTRDYVYVGDVARANLLALDRDLAGPINIGTGVETDVNRLFALIAATTGVERPPGYGPPKQGELRRSALDPRRAASQLGWQPEVPLAEGLARTVAALRGPR